MSNRYGIPNITSTRVDVTSTSVAYHFDESRDLPFAGIVLARLVQQIPAGTEDTLPVSFGNVQLKGYNNEDITVADLAGTGIVQVYYNSNSRLLQLMTGYANTTATATTNN